MGAQKATHSSFINYNIFLLTATQPGCGEPALVEREPAQYHLHSCQPLESTAVQGPRLMAVPKGNNLCWEVIRRREQLEHHCDGVAPSQRLVRCGWILDRVCLRYSLFPSAKEAVVHLQIIMAGSNTGAHMKELRGNAGFDALVH